MERGVYLDTQQGVMLLEGLIAILIFSLGILALVGLQSVSARATTDAKYRADASFLANQAIGMMWVDKSNLAAHAATDEPVASLPNGKRTIAVNGNAVTVTLTWQMPGESVAHNHTAIATIDD